MGSGRGKARRLCTARGLLVLGACLLEVTAIADTTESHSGPRVTFVAVPLDATGERALSSLWLVGEQALGRSPRFDFVPVTDVLDPAGAEGRASKLAEAESAFAQGTKLYDDLDTQSALAQFDRAIRAAEQTDLTRSFRLLSRAQVMRIAALVANGTNFLVDNEIDRALALNPRAPFSPNFFSPDWMAKSEKQRRLTLEGGRGRLEVRSTPSAAVYLNGQFRGASPLALTGLMRPEQFVTLKVPGYQLEQRRVFEAQVDWPLRKAPRARSLSDLVDAVRADPDGPGRDEAMRVYGRGANVDQVVLMMARAGAGGLVLTGLRLAVDDGHTYAFKESPVPNADALLTAADTLLTPILTEDAARRDGKPIHHGPATGGWSRRTTNYVLMGAGVAAIAAGVIFTVRGTRLHDKGSTVAGITLDVVGVAAAATGAYFDYASPKRRVAEEPTHAPAPIQAAPARPAPAPSAPAQPLKAPPARSPSATTPEEPDHRQGLRDQLDQASETRRKQRQDQERFEAQKRKREDDLKREKESDLRNY